MKNLYFLAAVFLCGAIVFAESPAPDKQALLFNWSLLWSGSWEEKTFTFSDEPALSGTLNNRGEVKLHFLPAGLVLRGQVLDRRPINVSRESINGVIPMSDPDKWVTNYTGGLYHKPTGSRLLYGVLDEWGLSARIRNPWIRSPPYAENHKPIIADARTTVSSTREDEIYLYLSSPLLQLSQSTKLRGFISAQTEVDEFTPALSGGIDLSFAHNTGLLLETFYTGKTLPPTKTSGWFSDSPPLPQREFRLYAAGFLFSNPDFAISSDFAMSETFAVGSDIYANAGLSFSPLLPFGYRARPLLISLAADGAGGQFVYRDGLNHGEGFRGAAKIEWKDRYSSLLRINTVLRSPGFGEDFNRSSTGFYWRFPSSAAIRNNSTIRLTRISLSADRNAVNPDKVSDGFSGNIGISLNLRQIGIKTPLGINFSGSIKGMTTAENSQSFFPIPDDRWTRDSTAINCDLIWSPLNFQLRGRAGITFIEGKEEKWDISASCAVRFKYGRLSLKMASPDFPEKWNWTISWRLEKKEKP
ncbi:MAG: hypothetical protein FWD22_00155 [Treponema sp.]|nr:hypothetical protein [Treponema sp.]